MPKHRERDLNHHKSLLVLLKLASNIGAAYDDLGEKQKALDYYNQALPLRRAVGDKAGEAHILGTIALFESERGNLNEALTQIEAAINIIEDLRTKIDNPQLRTSYFASVQSYYKFKIDLLMQLHKTNPRNKQGQFIVVREKLSWQISFGQIS